MKNEIKRFLEFNGKKIFFVAADGQWWIAIKPICEVLNVDYIRQFKNLKEDKILGQLLSDQTIVAADNRLRKMTCLPEFFIYGWIFQLQSNSDELQQYKLECYKVLFAYFHGSITGRKELISEKAKNLVEINMLEKKLEENQDHQRLIKLQKKLTTITSELRTQDKEVLNEELTLWENNN